MATWRLLLMPKVFMALLVSATMSFNVDIKVVPRFAVFKRDHTLYRWTSFHHIFKPIGSVVVPKLMSLQESRNNQDRDDFLETNHNVVQNLSETVSKIGTWRSVTREVVIQPPLENILPRRLWMEHAFSAVISSLSGLSLWNTVQDSCWADDDMAMKTTASSDVFVRQGSGFGYSIKFPQSMEPTQKPLKTHLDEINFVSTNIKGYQVGITVDPVRISTLREFGTPEEVAAKVVLAEVNRDGIFNVTLVKDPVEVPGGGYQLDYLSQGKRGDVHYVVQIEIQRQQLYVVTAQAPENIFEQVATEIIESLRSFRLV